MLANIPLHRVRPQAASKDPGFIDLLLLFQVEAFLVCKQVNSSGSDSARKGRVMTAVVNRAGRKLEEKTEDERAS